MALLHIGIFQVFFTTNVVTSLLLIFEMFSDMKREVGEVGQLSCDAVMCAPLKTCVFMVAVIIL